MVIEYPKKANSLVKIEGTDRNRVRGRGRSADFYMHGHLKPLLRGQVDQIFSFRMVVEKILAKGKKLYAAFTDLEKAYDRVDWLALWNVLKIYGVGGKLLSAVKISYDKASACVNISGETSEHSEI